MKRTTIIIGIMAIIAIVCVILLVLFNPKTNVTDYADTGNAELNKLCDEVLDVIVKESMSDREKAYQVYCWVENNITYSGVTEQSGWVLAGVTALTTRKGNCYAYYATSAALLSRLGIENTIIQEEDGGHFWNLVKIDGNWYHFDTTNGWGTQRFLWTDAQMDSYVYNHPRLGDIGYDWDHSKYPATP